jgi:catechol 2,3-dioxygenase-like lactoylglutathione lyase family enzyme
MSRLIYVIAFTPSFDRMRRFYEQGLGLRVLHHDGPSWVEYDTGGARLAVHAIDPDKRGIMLRFEANDIEGLVEAMSGRGVHFEERIGTHSFGRLAEFWDPDDRLISLLEPSLPFQSGSGLTLSSAILNSTDLPRAVAFYRDQVGLKVADEQPHWVEFDTGSTRVALHARPQRGDAPLHAMPRIALGFDVDDLDAFAETLRARDVHFAAAPSEEEFGVFAELVDPDGNVLMFRQPVPAMSLEERLAEPFEDEAPSRAAFRKPVKGAKATSRLAVRPSYRSESKPKAAKKRAKAAVPPRRKAAAAHSTRGAGPAGTRLKPKRQRDPKKARSRPATGRLKKAERRTLAQKKEAVARASKSRPVKRAAARKSRPARRRASVEGRRR